MRDLTEFSVTATAETVLKKLSKAGLPVYSLKKRGNRLFFRAESGNIKKVFAIFAHPCYNINVSKKSPKSRLLRFLSARFGLAVGAAAFVAAACFSQNFIFRIDVTGSGSYLKEEVLAVMRSQGVESGCYFRGLDEPLALSAIMALPDVTFCTIQKRGSVLVVDVQTDGQSGVVSDYRDLLSDVSGCVLSVSAICGTAAVAEGDEVAKGQTLIGAYYTDAAGERISCLAVGFATLSCAAVVSVPADGESDENRALALSAALLYSEDILTRSVRVRKAESGVIYEVSFTYRHTVKINME